MRRLNGSPRSWGWCAAPGNTASSAPSRATSTSQTAMNARPPRSRAVAGTASQPPRATSTGNGARASSSSGMRPRPAGARPSTAAPTAGRRRSGSARARTGTPTNPGTRAGTPPPTCRRRRRRARRCARPSSATAGSSRRQAEEGRLDHGQRPHRRRPQRRRQHAHDPAVGVAEQVGRPVEELGDVGRVGLEVDWRGGVGAAPEPAPVDDVQLELRLERPLLRERERARSSCCRAPEGRAGPTR